MPGKFLELSVWARDITASVAFWESLGLEHCLVGDAWKHRYAVLSDGRLVLGLHEYQFDSPSLTWVRPELAEAVPVLAGLGISFDFVKTGRDEFNEVGFRDPAGQVVTLLEARTWSPTLERVRGGLPGYFHEYRYRARDPAATVAFWERLGLVADATAAGPRVVADGINIAPRESATGPELVFEHDDLSAVNAALVQQGHRVEQDAGGLLLRAPDNLVLRIGGHC